jgi:hypothetical protein
VLDLAGPDGDASPPAMDSLNAAANGSVLDGPAVDSAVVSANAESIDPDSTSPGRDETAGRAPDGRGGATAGSTTGSTAEVEAAGRSAQGAESAAVSPSDPSSVSVDANRVLVLISGDRPDAAGSAQSVVLAQLLSAGRPVVDPDAVDAIRADAAAVRALQEGASPAAGVGRAYGAGIVVVADLSTDAAPAPGGFVTGTAVLTARFYDSRTGGLLLAETYRVGSGGTPGRPGPTETAAVTQAAESVGRQLARAILTKTGG